MSNQTKTDMTTDKLPNEEQREDYEFDTLTNDRLLKDHEYDGIRELDNSPPSWFNLLFIVTIGFAIIYLYTLWMFKPTGLVQEKEFAQEMAQAGSQRSAEPESGNFEFALLDDEKSLASGKEIYNNVCAVCHLVDGGGLVGPNFTDNYWIHGNSVEDMFKIVTEGVIQKGMIPYRDQLSPQQRLEVIAYILANLVGTQPANPKAPEGELML
jgi:cytochrome c oxidase cbb3-type subunit III